ncbi:GEM-like protein 5 [Rhodamnia argentea]|uniref:GEM-like protein 5 n=1 Tax=Rhodamnia argentea TaxID=178133 RepID=A0A8B8P199_9MYRT|nr:GEM-like protein 5 [Rhodamnia argentea]
MTGSTPEKPSSPKAAAPVPQQPSSPFAPTEPAPSSSSSSSSQAQPLSEEEAKKWGTHVMGTPAVPTVHPDNQKAASWNAADHQQISHQPYVQYEPIDRSNSSPLESVINMFNTWSKRAETIARNVWHNLKTGQSVSGAAWGKVNLTAKAISEGGFESLFKQIFTTDPNEKLKKMFACYLSTSTGPVAGTLYLSTARAAFCSDRPLSFTAPSGQEAWSYYKVMIPLANIGTVNPVVMKENPPEKYIQIVTADGHDFWFMGFVNFDKASHHLLNSLSEFRTVPPVTHPSNAP